MKVSTILQTSPYFLHPCQSLATTLLFSVWLKRNKETNSTYKRYYAVSVFFSLAYFTQHHAFQIHPCFVNSSILVHFSSLIPKMSMFTLAISCLTTSNLPWFVDLTFHFPMQCCFLQHWTLLLSSVTSTTGHCFHFGSISSFFLELLLHSSPVVYWAPTNLGSSSFSVVSFTFSFCSFFSKQEHWSGLPLSSLVDNIFSKLSTMTHPSWLALHTGFIASLSWTRMWSMWSVWLVFYDSDHGLLIAKFNLNWRK